MGSAIARSIELSLASTIEHTAFQLASRTVGAFDMNAEPEVGCTDYIGVIMDAAATTEFCSQYNFRNLNTLQEFIAPYWYSNTVVFALNMGWT
jgi:hypothetical protein